MRMLSDRRIRLAAALFALTALPMATISPAFAAQTVEKAIAAEKNPPGDIPDSQVFIDYTAPGGARLRVPEGWARSDAPDGASFVDKFDGVVLSVQPAAHPLSLKEANEIMVPRLKKEARAVKVAAVRVVHLPAGNAVRIVYSSNSEPNLVTGKQIRLENERFLFFKSGKLATLTLYAPFGADNVDQWRLMSSSFRWP
ncbi:hypothetical protein [Varunaivibrio sulfuroxidans]|uniref:Lipoprotein n=1 Tax=Varunaivibrio sulfuroxidans TaxID=1773489 RepID=A0A4R3JAS7_9PROT|nr:hypothetical protein [Varunaivibrio sulfuroxidans]TCS62978.1 hypothetical protein EDD55_10469 [Varunaivibrio sulfuroxidans]WES31944.1 hypothetical protein P3M64_06195 [Varunaivibrio sulfuroxidans]